MASDSRQLTGGRFALVGGCVLTVAAFAGAGILTQMSGCCGGAPTHGCKFLETVDAAVDSSSDAMPPCGFEICEPGVTVCCLEPESEPPIRCIALNQVCKGITTATCSGDQDCPLGSGTHCCGDVTALTTDCRADCPSDPSGGTARVCRVDAECPPERPKCTYVMIAQHPLFICL
jgi:hypothetical protein